MARIMRHRYVVRKITNYPRDRVNIWAVCDKFLEKAYRDEIPSISEVFTTREMAREFAGQSNRKWTEDLDRTFTPPNTTLRIVGTQKVAR